MTTTSESDPPFSGLAPHYRRIVPALLCGVFAIPVFVVNLEIAHVPARLGHDASWRMAYAHFFVERFQAGVDYAFPMGPYGYFLTPPYHPDLYWLNFAIQITLGAVVSFSFVALAARARTVVGGLALYALVLFILPFAGRGAYLFAGLVGMTMILLQPFRGRWAALTVIQGVMAFIALIKFGQFIVAACCVAAISAAFARQEGWKRGALVLAQYIGWLGLLWLMAGQRLLHFPGYIQSALDIGAAYNQTMMATAPEWEIAAAGLIAAMLSVAWGLSLWRRERSLERWIKPALFLVLLLLLWKSGFVRQIGHARQFFAVGAMAALCVDWNLVEEEGRKRIAGFLCAAVFAVAVVACVFAARTKPYVVAELPQEWGKLFLANGQALMSPSDEKGRFEQAMRYLETRYALPDVREVVGDSSIDILAHTQGLVLVNDLNYNPRFVFQGYQAGTSKLARLNGDHLIGEEAPEFLLGWITPIDQRYPTSEDSETIKATLWNYEPILSEEPYEVLRRRSPGRGPIELHDLEAPRVEESNWGEWVDTSADSHSWQLLTLDLKRTWVGALRETLYRPPFVFFETRMSDDEVMRWRIHRSMVDSGFILNPFLHTGAEMRAAYAGTATRWVTSFRVLIEAPPGRFFDPRIGINLRTIAPLTGVDAETSGSD